MLGACSLGRIFARLTACSFGVLCRYCFGVLFGVLVTVWAHVCEIAGRVLWSAVRSGVSIIDLSFAVWGLCLCDYSVTGTEKANRGK